MTSRHLALTIGAVLVFGLGVYLFIAVRAEPLPAVASTRAAAPPVREPVASPPVASPPVREPVASPPVEAPPVRVPAAAVASAPTPASAPVPEEEMLSGPKLDALMSEANKAYDHGELEEAKQMATRLLAVQPSNVRMLRILVSASCIDGDLATAQASYLKLPPPDQAQMRTRCSRYGVSLTDTP